MKEITLSVPAREFPVGDAMDGAPSGRAELEALASLGSAPASLTFVRGDGLGRFERRLAAHPSVADVAQFGDDDRTRRYRVTWDGTRDGLLGCISDADAVVRAGRGDRQRWRFALQFPDCAAVSSFHSACRRRDVNLEVDGVSTVDPAAPRQFGLTPEQRDLLVEASERGYFEVPRTTTLGDLAGVLDVSDQAVSARLRRATATLVENAII